MSTIANNPIVSFLAPQTLLNLAQQFMEKYTGNKVRSSLFQGNPIKWFIFLWLQVCLLFGALWHFNIEQDSRFPYILPVILVGFSIHFWLPKKRKLPFFVITSFASILVALGIFNGLVLIGIGAVLIIACHLPIKYNLKLLLLALITATLILFRANIFVVQPIPYLIPFIGTMFMLRLIIYVYDLKYDQSNTNMWHRIAYFFLMPNVCFPLFPLVDFKIFKTTYYNIDRFEIYSIGLRRIFRGAIHLLTYRILYYLVVPDPSEIDGLYSILQFVIFSYTLILRLSGMYHISLGVLSLFGFNLPEIFNNYFFASSFNNIWKRINIYWREALMKVFYYPIYFKIRKINKTYAVSITILMVFVLNWAMHGYQWFWVRGSFPLEPNDFLFWMVFGTAVMINSLYLQKIKEPQKIGAIKIDTFSTRFLKVIKPIGMFAFMSSIWLMWSSSSLKEWLYLLSFFAQGTANQWLIVGSSFVGFILVLILLNYSYQDGWLRGILNFYSRHLTVITFCCILALFAISFPKLTNGFKVNDQPFISFLQENKLNEKDKKTMERGYYQKLLTSDNNALKLSQIQLKKPKKWYNNDAYYKTNDLLRKRFKSNYTTVFKKAKLSTNSWGMRDKEYALNKDQGTYRIALLGGSYEMGAGVNNNETFEAVTEEMLNQHYSDSVEILNFAVGGYHLVEGVFNLDSTLKFNPDAIIYTAHSNEMQRLQSRFIDLITSKVEIEDSFVLSIKNASGIEREMCMLEKQNRLKPFTSLLLKWGYSSIASKCIKKNITPIWMYLPALGDEHDPDYNQIISLAKSCGFLIITVDDPYQGQQKRELMVAPWDFHLNKKGHELVATKLFKELTSHDKELKLH